MSFTVLLVFESECFALLLIPQAGLSESFEVDA